MKTFLRMTAWGALFIISCLMFWHHGSVSRGMSRHLSVEPHRIDWSAPIRAPRRLENAFGLHSARVGSPAWRRLYPDCQVGPRPRPSWIARYNYLLNKTGGADSLALVRDIPVATLNDRNGLAEYPAEVALGGHLGGVCSYRRGQCIRGAAEDWDEGMLDVWEGQEGTWAINFDDGPLPPTRSLLDFLEVHSERATHFWIGCNVLRFPQLAQATNNLNMHLAVHTWSHPHLTTLTDEQILGELGWTLQIISDLTGKVPRYFRPPFGDVDNRVRLIAKHVFDLTTVLWNGDSSDWTLNQTWAMGDFVDPPMQGFTVSNSIANILDRARWDRTVGAIILEHELSEESVEAFTATYTDVKKAGWKTATLADCIQQPWYQ